MNRNRGARATKYFNIFLNPMCIIIMHSVVVVHYNMFFSLMISYAALHDIPSPCMHSGLMAGFVLFKAH